MEKNKPQYVFAQKDGADHSSIKIVDERFKDVIFDFGSVGFAKEENDKGELAMKFDYTVVKNPNNIDLRYKLLEVYAQAGDEIAFEGEVHFIKSKNIVSMFDPLHQKIAKLRDKYFE